MHTPEAAGTEGALDGEILQGVLALGHPWLRLGLLNVHAAIGRLGDLLLLLLLLLLREAGWGGIGGRGVY